MMWKWNRNTSDKSPLQEQEPAKIENLLQQQFMAMARLGQLHQRAIQRGIAPSHLPTPQQQQAFALLGDHERAVLLHNMAESWQSCIDKGIVHRPLNTEVLTAELRFVRHIEAYLPGLDGVLESLNVDINTLSLPTAQHLRCADHVQGLWGQIANIHFQCNQISHLLIQADRVFGRAPVLLAAEEGVLSGTLAIPIDRGNINFIVMSDNGQVYGKKMQCNYREI